MNKAEANYRVGDEISNCGNCKNYLPPEGCSVVKGKVAANGLCDIYASNTDTGGANTEQLMAQLFGGPNG